MFRLKKEDEEKKKKGVTLNFSKRFRSKLIRPDFGKRKTRKEKKIKKFLVSLLPRKQDLNCDSET